MIRISVSRNLAEHPFVPAMGVEDFAEVERVLLLALRSLQHDELHGSYTPLAALDEATLASLKADGLYAEAVDPPYHAAATSRDGLLPVHRAASGVFRAANGQLAAWVNASDHLQVVGAQRNGSARTVFEAVHSCLAFVEKVLLEQGKTYALHRRLGYVGACPSLVGTSMRVHVRVALPALTATGSASLGEVAAEYGLRALPLPAAAGGGGGGAGAGGLGGGGGSCGSDTARTSRGEHGGSAGGGSAGGASGSGGGSGVAARLSDGTGGAATREGLGAFKRRSRGVRLSARVGERERRMSGESSDGASPLRSTPHGAGAEEGAEGAPGEWGASQRLSGGDADGGASSGAFASASSSASSPREWWEVSNRSCLGRTEVQLTQLVLDGAAALRAIEQRLAGGESLLQAMTPPPPPEAASVQLARAVRRSAASGRRSPLALLTLSSTAQLPVLDWAGRASALTLAGLRLYDRDATLLAELLTLNTGLASVDLSQCRMTEAGSMAIARSLRLSCPLSTLTELRLADNRLRVSGAHALLDALEASACSLSVLDLSANELCGGTVAEDHSFGLIKGSAARLSEHGQLCRLDSDGLCSAGPRMEPSSGCYRIELEVLQASDGDGAYVGVIRPDANKASYPGSDDKGVGWRAKGGVRHLHNTVDLGGALVGWGQGDRIGLMLDTHTSELTFYKNGKALEQRYTLQIDGPLLFAVGRYYGSYVVRCLYVHQQGGNEEMDYSALERLCAMVHAPGNSLRELRVASNQLTGVSKFHGGRRNERGLQRLLRAFEAPQCRLTHLDVSGNGLSAEDAATIVAIAMRCDSSVRLLKLHTWLVPVRRLASDETLDLRSQAMADEDAVLLSRLLETRTHLTHLDLQGNRLGTQGVTALADAVAASGTPLRWLSVASNRLGAVAACALLDGLHRAKSSALQSLDLSDNPITSSAPEASSAAFDTRALSSLATLLLEPTCQLRSLGLASVQLCGRDGDAAYVGEGLSMLASALRRSRAPLEALKLSGNAIRDAEAAMLASTLAERRTRGDAPFSLDLSTNSLSSSRLASLAALCPLKAAFQRPLCERTYVGFDKCVYGAATTDEAIFLAHGSGTIVKVSLSEWKELGRYEGHTDDTNCLTLHGDDLLLSGSDDYTVKLWSTSLSSSGEGACLATLSGHEARVWCIVASDEYVYSCSADKSIVVWSLDDARRGVSTQLARLTSHTDVVYALRLAFGKLFSSSADKTINCYQVPKPHRDGGAGGAGGAGGEGGAGGAAGASSSASAAAAAASSSTSTAPSPSSAAHAHQLIYSWEAHAHSITCLVACEPLGLLCSGAEDGRISLWRVGETSASSAGTLSARPSGGRTSSSNLAVYALAVSPSSGTVLFAGGADYRVHMYDLVHRTLLHTLTGHASTVRALCFTRGGDRLCSSGGDFNLLVWRVPGGEGCEGGEGSEGGEGADFPPAPAMASDAAEDATAPTIVEEAN